MTSPAAQDARLVWHALRVAGGRVEDAALALGMTSRELVQRLADYPMVHTSGASGTRRTQTTVATVSDDDHHYNPFGGDDDDDDGA